MVCFGRSAKDAKRCNETGNEMRMRGCFKVVEQLA